ncbi:MAG: ABC transporter substrate-binding protein [Bilophila wadsworthia]
MMRRLLVLLSLLVLAAVQPAHSALLSLASSPPPTPSSCTSRQTKACSPNRGWKWNLSLPERAGARCRHAGGALSGHFGDIINVLMQNESGSPQAIVATTSHSSPDNRCFGLVVSPKSKAQTLADLKGKDIAVSSATIIDFLLAQLLQQEGAAPYFLNRQDIRQIPVRLQMLLSGQIESALLPEPLVSLVEAKGARTILNDCKLNTPLAVIALKRDVLDAPDGAQTVAKFREALREAAKRINETPDAYRPIMEAKGLLPKGASANYTMVRFDMTHTPTGLPSEADIKTFADWMKANRILKKDPAYGDVVFQ